MNVVPLQVARVSNQLRSSLLLNSLQSGQVDLLKVQNQIATGQQLNRASDDPAAALGIDRLRRAVNANEVFDKNLDFAAGFLNTADTAIGQLTDLVNQAKSVASSQLGASSSPSERAAQATVIDSLIQRAYALANKRYQNASIFGGQNGTQDAFITQGGGYRYNGSQQAQGILTPDGSTIDFTLNGNDIFGGLSSQVVGYQDLTPALTNATRLSDLKGAALAGVQTGSIDLTIGATTTSVDLTGAATVGDVLNLVNDALTTAGTTATLAISGGRFVLNGDATSSITISDPANTTTARDLGIDITVAATTSGNGAVVGPKITATTTLASLRGGLGLDASGIVISNGANSATITLTGLTTVEDLLNRINGSGTFVHAEINAAGSGINLFNPLSGTPLRVGENGGQTAEQLGVRSLNAGTNLSELNYFGGITPISSKINGPQGNITVTRTDGASFTVKVDGVKTPQDLINAINTAAGNTTVTATLNASGNGITLTDTSGGAGNLSVAAATGFTSNGTNLGILTAGAGATLTGSNITFSTDDLRITNRGGAAFTVNFTGAQSIQDVIDAINNADGNTTVTAALNANGNGISLADTAVGAGALTVTALNSSPVATQLGIYKIAGGATPGVINGDDVNPLQPKGVFSSLALLRDALLANDNTRIQQAAALLEEDGTRLIKARGTVGARARDVENRKDDLVSDQTQLKKSLTELSETDMTEAITRYQTLQTAYEASLKVASTTQNLSLLDFLR